MGRFIVGLLIGIVAGGILIYFLFAGAPHANQFPGTPIKPPDAQGNPFGTAQLVLNQDLVNEALGAIFHEMNPPTFPLGSGAQTLDTQGGQACASQITIVQEGSGVQTSVRFENNKLIAPLAFTGSYASPMGCLQFSGWAQSNLELRFDRDSQNVYGTVNVETVNLDGVNPVFMGLITPIVQATLNNRVNPIRIVDGRQLTVNLPVAASNGNLQGGVQDVRAEVKDNALNLFVIYDFKGGPASNQAAAQ
jgi:hypothetical protein